MQVIVGLLTGGLSSRMGTDKATLRVAGRSMAEHVASACAEADLETIVLGPADAGTGLEHLPDDRDVPPGPLGGLITLMRKRPGTHVILLATDQPFVRPETLRRLASLPQCDVVVPIDDDDWPQVTCARYGPDVLAEFEVRRGSADPVWRLRALLERPDVVRVLPAEWRTWGEDGRSFRSLDRPDDIDRAIEDGLLS